MPTTPMPTTPIPAGATPSRPMLVTADEEMLDDLLRMAAAAEVEVTHTREPTRSGWRDAGLVLLDAACAGDLRRRGLPARSGVVAVSRSGDSRIDWEQCIGLGVERTVRIGEADELLVELLADTSGAGAGDGQVVAVIGACGGAGASVLATALATVADGRGRRVLLVDLDLHGPGLDMMTGIDDRAMSWSRLRAPSGRLSAAALHEALPTAAIGHGNISVLCHERTATADIDAAVADVVVRSGRMAGDLVVVDVPRANTDAGDQVLARADLVLLVATADLRSCFGGSRTVNRLVELGVAAQLVLRGPVPGTVGAAEMAAAFGLPLLTKMRPEPRLNAGLDTGSMPGSNRRGPLARAAADILDHLAVGRS